MWPQTLFRVKVLPIENLVLIPLVLSAVLAHLVKRDLLIEDFLPDGEDFDPVTAKPVAEDSVSLFKSNKSSLATSFQHRYLPFRVKIFNESEDIATPLLDIDELPSQFYLHDSLLDFDSPYQLERFFDCTIKYQRFSRYHNAVPREPYEDDLNHNSTQFVDKAIPLQVEISGSRCDLVNLVLLQLKHKHNITHLVLRGTALRQIGRHYFGDARLYSLRRIDVLENAQLTYIDQRAFDELAALEILRVFHCATLHLFHRQALVGLKALQQFLWASNSPLDSELFLNLTRAAASHTVPALKQLYIASTPVADSPDLKLTKDDLIQLRQVETLHFVSCNLRFSHPLTFTFLGHLQSLSLADNPRLSLDNLIQVFSTLSKLSKTVKLSRINLSGSLSTPQLPKLLLLPIGKLQVTTLRLASISLHSIAAADVPPMPHLQRFILDGNPIEWVEDHALDALENLQHLSLVGNRLQVIRSELFYNLPRLTYLDLSGTVDSAKTALKIEPKTFVGLNIRILNLSYRILDPLSDKVFLGLHKTEKLYLRGCELHQIEYLTFFFLKSLRLIDLSENAQLIESLRETHDDSFFGLESIESIHMSGCNLTSADLNGTSGIFTRIHEHVQELDLSGNRLDTLSAGQFSQFAELRALNLSGNQIRPWTNHSVFRQNAELLQLDLSNNQLEYVSSTMMEDLYRMQNLSFGHNPLQCDCSFEFFNSEWLQSAVNKPVVFMDSQNPLQSASRYYCVFPHNGTHQRLHHFSRHCAKRLASSQSARSLLVNSTLVIVFILFFFLISLSILAISFVYYSQLNQAFATYFRKGSAPLEDNAQYEYDAFVSYNAADSDWIFSQLVPNIEMAQSSNRVRLCVYDRDFIAGRPISECILESIRQSRRVILVVSNQFIKSPWCRYETDLAHHHNTLLNRTGGIDGLVLIKLEPIEPGLAIPIQLEFLLKTRIYLEWNSAASKEERDRFWCKLKSALGIPKGEETTKAAKWWPPKLSLLRDKFSKIIDDFLKWPVIESDFLQEPENQPNELYLSKSEKQSTQKNVTKKLIKGRRKMRRQDAIDQDNAIKCIKYCSRDALEEHEVVSSEISVKDQSCSSE